MADIIRQATSNFLGDDILELEETIVTGSIAEDIMRFPLDLGDNGRPMMHFECVPHESDEPMQSMFFPCPQGVTYGDGGEYTTFDLGLLGEFSKSLAKAAGGKGSAALEAAKSVKSMFEQEMSAVGFTGASIIAARRLGFDDIATNAEFANKQVMNPRTNSAFSGNSIRNFQFEFKMIGKSPPEVRMIDSIQKTFRKYVYAEKYNKTSSFMLKYPPQWIIRFIDPLQNELKFMPKIYSCYLTSVNTVVNSSSNTFRREDLSPYEIDISLQFQETKVLTRDEIVDLEENGNRENAFDHAFQSLLGRTENLAGEMTERLSDFTQKNIKAIEEKASKGE